MPSRSSAPPAVEHGNFVGAILSIFAILAFRGERKFKRWTKPRGRYYRGCGIGEDVNSLFRIPGDERTLSYPTVRYIETTAHALCRGHDVWRYQHSMRSIERFLSIAVLNPTTAHNRWITFFITGIIGERNPLISTWPLQQVYTS